MDILFASPDAPADKNIGTLILFSSKLHDSGHSVSAIQTSDTPTNKFPVRTVSVAQPASPWWANLWRYYRSWRTQMDDYLTHHSPDVIVADRRAHVPTVQVAATHGIPVVAVIEGLGFMRFAPNRLTLDKTPRFRHLPLKSKIQYPFIRSLHRQQTRAFQEFAAVVSLSEFLQETIKATFDVDSTLIRTSIDPSAVRASDFEPQYITMVNPRSELKGAGIFIRLAQQLPEYDFLIAGEFLSPETREAAVSLENVTHLGWVDDMRRVYRQTKLLVVPSLVEEGGPRVICEAFANGIPVVGTNRGGIPGFIGSAGAVVTDPYDISMWERRIDQVFQTYERKVAAANERIELFDATNNVWQFESLLKAVTE